VADFRIEEFSNLPSAKLTVEEFREIWFQNSADPPSFATPGAREVEDDDEENPEPEGPTQIEDNERGAEESGGEGNEQVAAAEAESAFLEEIVADRTLEEEINRHLNQQEFQQALAEMDTIRQQQTQAIEEEGNLSDLDDDDEVAGAIIDADSEHFLLRAQLWMQSNRDYLKEQRGISLDAADDRKTITGGRR
jgi:transcription factor IIIB subunit 2